MSLKNIAVESWTYSFGAGTGSVSVTNQPSKKVKFDGKKAFYNSIQISISGYTGKGITGGSGVGVIMGSAEHVNIEGMPAVLEGDESEEIPITGTSTTYPYPTLTINDTVKVLTAGQTKAKGS